MPFKKGQSGNPEGKNQKPVLDALRMELAAAGEDHKSLRDIMRIVVAQAKAGKQWAVEFISDRLDGRPVQQIESHNVNENSYVRAPSKASDEDWKSYLDFKTKPKPTVKSNVTSNGKSH